MNQRIALYAGSFDPFTNGHLDIVRKASALFDRVVVMIGVNVAKRRAFDAEAMRAAIQRACDDQGLPVTAVIYTGLVADYCRAHGIRWGIYYECWCYNHAAGGLTIPFSLRRSASLVTSPTFKVGSTYTVKTKDYEKTFTLSEAFTAVR